MVESVFWFGAGVFLGGQMSFMLCDTPPSSVSAPVLHISFFPSVSPLEHRFLCPVLPATRSLFPHLPSRFFISVYRLYPSPLTCMSPSPRPHDQDFPFLSLTLVFFISIAFGFL